MSIDRRTDVSGPILTFTISTLPRTDSDRGSWQAMIADLSKAFMEIQNLRDEASDLARVEATAWAMETAAALHHQVTAEAAACRRRLAA